MGEVAKLKKETGDTKIGLALNTPLSLTVPWQRKLSAAVMNAFKRAYGASWGRCRNWCERMESTRLLGEFTALALRLDRDNFHVKVSYSGSINHFSCLVYLGKYHEDANFIPLISGGNHNGLYRGALKPKNIRAAMKRLIALSKACDAICPRYLDWNITLSSQLRAAKAQGFKSA